MSEKKGIWLLNLLTILLFCGAIVVPMLLFHHEEGRIVLLENKAAAAKPKFSDYNNIFDGRLPEDLDEYFSDNIGLRDEAIQVNVFAKYRWFHTLDVPNYILGKEGHLFYMTESAIMKTYQGLDMIPEEQEQKLVQDIIALDAAVQDRGSEFVFMSIPNKEQIYNEFVPDNICVLSNGSMLRHLMDRLLSDTSLHIVDTEQALLNHKNDGHLLYYRNFDATHWNYYGAFCGYMALMEEIRKIDPDISYLTLEDMTVYSEETTPFNNLEGKLDTFSNLSDLQYTVQPKSGWNGVCEYKQPTGFSLISKENVYLHYVNPKACSNKSLLVWGDSYIKSYMLPYLSESFSDVYFLYNTECSEESLIEFCSYIKTDIVLYESVSRAVNSGVLRKRVNRLYSAVSQEWDDGPRAEVCIRFSDELTHGEYYVFWAEDYQFNESAMERIEISGGQAEMSLEIPAQGWNTLRLAFPQGISATYSIASITVGDKRCVIDNGGGVEIVEADGGWRIKAGMMNPWVTFHTEAG